MTRSLSLVLGATPLLPPLASGSSMTVRVVGACVLVMPQMTSSCSSGCFGDNGSNECLDEGIRLSMYSSAGTFYFYGILLISANFNCDC